MVQHLLGRGVSPPPGGRHRAYVVAASCLVPASCLRASRAETVASLADGLTSADGLVGGRLDLCGPPPVTAASTLGLDMCVTIDIFASSVELCAPLSLYRC